MSLPVLLTSDMTGSPILTPTNGSVNALLNACLVNGFNTQSVVTATAASGVVTFNFASAPGFSANDTVTVAGASNSTVNGQFRVQSAASNQVMVAIPGVPDGAVGGTITLKFSPLGWTRPYSGTGIGCYKQGGAATHKRFVRVYDNTAGASPYAYYIRGYENMTAVSTGTGAFPTTAQVAGNGQEHYAASNSSGEAAAFQHRAWVIVGTPRFFVLYAENGRAMYSATPDTLNPVSSVAWSAMSMTMFGELANVPKPADTYACICPAYYLGWTIYAPRGVSGTGTARGVVVGMGGQVGQWNHGLQYPSAADGGIHFNGTLYAYDDTTPYGLRGTLPGTLVSLESTNESGSVPPVFGYKFTNIPGVTGRVMYMGSSSNNHSAVGWLLDEDWGDL